MSGVAPVLRRVRSVVGTAGVERLGPDGARLVLRRVLFDGAGVPEWRRAAACADVDPSLFFPAGGPGAGLAVAAAKRVCRVCPVRATCIADVMAWEQPSGRYGVVGGLSPNERQRLHLRQTRAGGVA
jgi:WhiB family transcriptional regulator, redox-sensing transcriptional regulator